MFVTIRQILSVMGKNELVSIFQGDTEEFAGTVGDCQNALPNAVLDNMVSSIHALSYYGDGVLAIYKEKNNEH